MNQPKVSVIIPVYNTAPYLHEAIGSIMNQTLSEIEILVVNDGSTDNSKDIIQELASQDNRIRYFEQENQGQSVARNVGLEHAAGKYIYFMDSDDIISTDALEKSYLYCERLHLDFVFFDGEILYENSRQALSWDYHRTGRYAEEITYQGIELMNDMLDNYTHRAVPWLWLVKRGYLDEINLRFYPGIIHEDELFSVLLFVQSHRIGCLKKVFVKHRVRNNSTMAQRYSLRNVNCYLTVIEQLFLFANKHTGIKDLIKKYTSYTLNAVFRTAHILPAKDKLKALRRCIHNGYIRYISTKVLLLFMLKR